MFEWLPERIEQAKIISQEFSLDWRFILNLPATEAEIRTCETDLGVLLPLSYREFLLRWNGASLFREESQLSGGVLSEIGIKGTHELLNFNREEKVNFTNEEWDSLILFCYLGMSADYCGFDPSQEKNAEYAVLDCFHELEPAQWRQSKIASSFIEWLEQIFEQVAQKKHPFFWLGSKDLW
ncbi:SMI1/KNR4 family protein [Gloeocapsopsis dulcis]|uniref:Knr4/Smi1-like domain-containing protein n=1 Tax=Gloeocapsopsis dulcis AAB1 = 1H9 TaxID=1433147 RepID=A0A6N8G1T6_9CHRO|nr:SMI1/KNR4 family protein [Gloeocapsopsis dulcis]MUL38317.1 hypothetical protein [Gloeocapsopsis dulcis AAB1 = 1H9]WNN91186.1 SMI1/KNR4 family protein [Gloeocapsopsis dulcis]